MIETLELHILIERLATRTFPAETAQTLANWTLRASSGITKRANSVFTATGGPDWNGDLSLYEACADFYAEHGLPLRFHVSSTSPRGLDNWLSERGFELEMPCLIMTAGAADALAQTEQSEDPAIRVVFQPAPDSSWLDDFIRLEGLSAETRPFYEGVFARIEPTAGFLRLFEGDHCVGIGTSIVEDGWAGLTNIAVLQELRGRGLGKRIVHELAGWSLRQGADRLYLQVVENNEPARRLYAVANFAPTIHYHYRLLSPAPSQ